jgi:colanic acid/amylovoran biosynthesis protein
MRAMLACLDQALGGASFTVLYQFRDRALKVELAQDVQMLPIIMPATEAARLTLFGLSRLVSTRLGPLLLGRLGKAITEAYERADLVLSAPGGPYFGDIYASHELVHWFFVWLAKRYHKPLMLYSPSAGPFANPILNPVRRHLYRAFDVVCAREPISARMIEELVGQGFTVHVTADSALQVRVPPMDRAQYFGSSRSHLTDRFIVCTSVIDYRFAGASDPNGLKSVYERALINLMTHLSKQRDCHFLFLPQLHGSVHTDVPYLRRIAGRLPSDLSWEIVDEHLDSDAQRGIFGMADTFIASRYHPAIFGSSAGVPGLCFYYEHKALGFMTQLGMERFAFDIRKLDSRAVCKAMDEILENRATLSREIELRLPALVAQARQSTELAVALAGPTVGSGAGGESGGAR